jgi:nitrite reductase/ring-hydroxylating ferredoxin subunit
MPAADANWLVLCATADVETFAPKRVMPEGMPPLAVFQLEDEYFVIDDTCTHGEASLCEGYIAGDEIECAWHGGKFCIRDGQPTAFPAVEPLHVYKVRVLDGQVCIEQPAA